MLVRFLRQLHCQDMFAGAAATLMLREPRTRTASVGVGHPHTMLDPAALNFGYDQFCGLCATIFTFPSATSFRAALSRG